jgi:hypothetical protein
MARGKIGAAAAAAFVDFLRTPTAAAAISTRGLEPAGR